MPFAFVFDGTFFDMERFLADVQDFVQVKGDRVDVSGRLLSVDGFNLQAGPGGFPNVKADISATAYLLSPDDSASASPATSSATSTGTSASGTSASASGSGSTPSGGSTPASTGGAVSEVAR